MSVSSTLTSAVMTDMSARVIRVEPSAFWMPTTTVSPSRTGTLVTRPSKGARLMVLSRASKLARWLATAWSRWARWDAVWALGLGERGDALVEGGGGDVVGGLLGVEVLLGDELGVVEGLGAVEVEFFLLQVGAWPAAMLAWAVFSAAT